MFDRITLHGGPASLVLGYKDAVVLRTWRITKADGRWTLTATVARVDPFLSRQRPLVFAAPRPQGFWCWPLVDLQLGATHLSATLGPPEQ